MTGNLLQVCGIPQEKIGSVLFLKIDNDKKRYGMGFGDRSGERAVGFELLDEKGSTVTLEQFHGSWLWLIFRRHQG